MVQFEPRSGGAYEYFTIAQNLSGGDADEATVVEEFFSLLEGQFGKAQGALDGDDEITLLGELYKWAESARHWQQPLHHH